MKNVLWFGALALLVLVDISVAEGENEDNYHDTLLNCCTTGEEHATKENSCIGFQPPTVPSELIGACFFSSEICCTSKLRIEQCKLGVQAAKSGVDCHNAGNETGTEFYKNCCEACKVGLIIGAMQEECSLGVLYGIPFDDSFNYCCSEMKSGDSFVLKDDENICTKFDKLCSQKCEATDDSYVCKCNEGYKLLDDKKTCVKDDDSTNGIEECQAGYTKNEQTGECDDIDECEGTDVTCNMDNQVCYNTKGSYKCLYIKPATEVNTCPSGFQFDSKIKQCVDINECETKVAQCGGMQCVNVPGGYECIESKAASTKKPTVATRFSPKEKNLNCPKGYKAHFDKCVDIDECLVDKSSCDSNQNCINTPGSFECECKTGFSLDKVYNACVDINECQINNHDCLDTQRCDNTIGSYTCTRMASCGTGYTLNSQTGHCDDDDECLLGRHNCIAPYECRNTKGSFRCDKPRTTTTTTTTTTTQRPTTTTKRPYIHTPYTAPYSYTQTYSHRYTVLPTTPMPRNADYDRVYGQCSIGFRRNSQGACTDIDECFTSNPCRSNQRCINTNGSYKCQNLLSCSGGYASNDEGTQCVDIDECSTGTANCGPDEICKNKPGGYTCSCPSGLSLNANRRCEDVNECDFYKGQVCSSNSECINTHGSFRCECKDGFRKNGHDDKSCVDVDECAEMENLCSQRCINYWGSYRCACNQGFRLSDNNRTCEDIDECEVHKAYNLCLGVCQNTIGSYQCACPAGYKLREDGRSCQDIDECTTENVCTGQNEICTNVRGTYRCTYKDCPSGYMNDAGHNNRCKRISLTCEQGDTDCMNQPVSITYHFITLTSSLSLPPNGRVLFTYKGPSWFDNIDFHLKINHVQAPSSIRKASDRFFSMEKIQSEARLSLMESLEGPQDIELEMSMTVFREGQPSGKNVAKIFIFVSEYQF